METVDFIGKIAKVDSGFILNVGGELIHCTKPDEIGPAFVSKLVEKRIMQDYDDQFTQMELQFPDNKEK
jgi:hypothetical protein